MAGRSTRAQLRALATRLPRPIRQVFLIPAWRIYERWLLVSQKPDVHQQRLIERREGGRWPIPAPKLRVLVVADPDPAYFLRSGKAQVEMISEMLARNDVFLRAQDQTLDFGCGCGRMARWWPDVSEANLFGCDYNAELAEWCADNLPFMETAQTRLKPPLPYSDGQFSFIYALSIFTHLPSELEVQ